MSSFGGYSVATFSFLEELAFNNNRGWFEAHRGDYETAVVEPSLALIADMEPLIRSISPHFRAVAKKSGGSLMRIYRDTRFARDKTPYKTNIGIQFRHELAADVHTPAFYVHLATDECFIGAGTWHPEPSDLKKIRTYLSEHPDDYRSATAQAIEASGMSISGEALKKAPRGFDPDHPLATELRRIDFLLSADLEPTLYLEPGLVAKLERSFSGAAPYMRFLCEALEAPF